MSTITTPRFFVAKPNKDGSFRCYWQAPAYTGAKAVALGRDVSAAIARCHALNAALDAGLPQPAKAGAVTIAGAFKALFRDQATRGLAANTLRQYRQVQRLMAAIGADRRRLDAGPGTIADQLADRPSLRAAALRVLRMLANRHGVRAWDRLGISCPRAVTPAAWADQDVLAFMRAAEALGRPSVGLALAINHWLGQRPVDALALQRPDIRTDRQGRRFLALRQDKTGQDVELPLSPWIEQLLQAAELRDRALADRLGVASLALIVSEETGQAYRPDAFRSLFRRIRDAAAAGQVFLGEIALPAHPALAGKRFSWCRHTAESDLAEANVAVPGMAAWLGHSTATAAKMADTYTVTRRRIAQAAGAVRLAGSALHRGELAPQPSAAPAGRRGEL